MIIVLSIPNLNSPTRTSEPPKNPLYPRHDRSLAHQSFTASDPRRRGRAGEQSVITAGQPARAMPEQVAGSLRGGREAEPDHENVPATGVNNLFRAPAWTSWWIKKNLAAASISSIASVAARVIEDHRIGSVTSGAVPSGVPRSGDRCRPAVRTRVPSQ